MSDDPFVSPSFRLSEFTNSSTAVRKGLDNTPAPEARHNIDFILAPRMQAVRDVLRAPVFISSGYRSPAVNAAVGGAATSAHMRGLAADFTCPAVGSPRAVALFLLQHVADLRFDQLIFEGQWVHIAFPGPGEAPRRQVLTAHFSNGGVTYTEGIA